MKALLFHKFRNICIKTILWTRKTNCFTIFVLRNFRRKAIQTVSIIYVVPRPRKWGLPTFCKFLAICSKFYFAEKNDDLCWLPATFTDVLYVIPPHKKYLGRSISQQRIWKLFGINVVFFLTNLGIVLPMSLESQLLKTHRCGTDARAYVTMEEL